MPITVSDTTSWTNIGAQQAAQATYAAVKAAIEQHPELKRHNLEIFLQGSYANSTNIIGDSDVDIVVMSKRTFYYDIDSLSSIEKYQYHQDFPGTATYTADQLRRDVHDALVTYFGKDRVEPKKKCIRVHKRDGYLDADVVPAFPYRLYRRYSGYGSPYIEGTMIFPPLASAIINYPKEHKRNGEVKNRLTTDNFKPTVRQFKNLKKRAVNAGRLDAKLAPGYLVECMVYNVPDHLFHSSHHDRMLAILRWLLQAELQGFKSADEVHRLFRTDPGNFSAVIGKDVVIGMAEELVH